MKKFSEWIGPIREAQVNEASELQKSYQDYFKAKLAKYDAKSPADLSDEEKSKFFNEISAEWESGQGVKPAAAKKVKEEEVEAGEKAKKEAVEEKEKDTKRPAKDVTELTGSAEDKLKNLTK